MKDRIISLIPDKQLADKISQIVINTYKQIKIAKNDIDFIRKNEQKIASPDGSSNVSQNKSSKSNNSNVDNKNVQSNSQPIPQPIPQPVSQPNSQPIPQPSS